MDVCVVFVVRTIVWNVKVTWRTKGFKQYKNGSKGKNHRTGKKKKKNSRWGHACSSLVFVVCCVGSGLYDELITRSEESYRVCVCVCLIVCDVETSTMRRPRSELGCCATEKKIY
jgi:hypothetical protein